jgi:hypothetical protein
MNGCKDGHWVLGRAHDDPVLPATTVATNNTHYARVEYTGVPAHSAAEVWTRQLIFDLCSSLTRSVLQCVAQVRTNFPDANAAQYSNIGNASCFAVYAGYAPCSLSHT